MSRITAATGAGQTVMQRICISSAVWFVETNGRGAGRQMQSPLLVVNRDDIAKRTGCSLCHGGSFLLAWLRLATTSSARFGAAALTKCAKQTVRHRKSHLSL